MILFLCDLSPVLDLPGYVFCIITAFPNTFGKNKIVSITCYIWQKSPHLTSKSTPNLLWLKLVNFPIKNRQKSSHVPQVWSWRVGGRIDQVLEERRAHLPLIRGGLTKSQIVNCSMLSALNLFNAFAMLFLRKYATIGCCNHDCLDPYFVNHLTGNNSHWSLCQ